MKLSKMKKEELELYSYIDLTKMIFAEEKKPLNTPTIFKKICALLEMTDDEYADKIGDFYTSLTTDKNFVLLDDGNWDLRDHHPVDMILGDDDEDIEDDTLDEEEEIDEMPLEDDLGDGDTDDSMDDTLEDEEDDEELTIISEEELDED